MPKASCEGKWRNLIGRDICPDSPNRLSNPLWANAKASANLCLYYKDQFSGDSCVQKD